MKNYTSNPGDVTLFAHEAGGNPKAPQHSGFIIAHRDIRAGEKLGISLWEGKPGSSKTFGGKIQDYRNKKPEERAKEAGINAALDKAANTPRSKFSQEYDEMADIPF